MSAPFSDAQLVAQACQQTGLSDFGHAGWHEGLARLVDSINEEAHLNEAGRQIFRVQVDARLCDRLRIVDWAKRYPDECQGPIETPLFVLGMLRTGTTFVSALLHCDPRNRSLMKWEAHDPIPPPTTAHFHDDPRIARAVAQAEWRYQQMPEMRAVHYEPGDGPTECVFLLGQSFRSQEFSGLYQVPAYSRWHHASDLRPAYLHHRQVLQVLQSRAPGRWCLKAPGHAFGLEAILELHPSARFVMTHRHPLETVPSACFPSIAGGSLGLHERLAPSYWGQEWFRVLGESVDRMLDFRDQHPEVPVYDLFFERLLEDPVREIARLYERFGEPIGSETRGRMQRYAHERPRHHFGRFEMGLEELGLTRSRILERFEKYIRTFELRETAP